MTTNSFPWIKIALIGAAIGVSALIGYTAFNYKAQTPDEEVIAEKKKASANQPIKKKKKQPQQQRSGTSSKTSTASKSTASVSEKDPFTAALEICDESAEVLSKLPVDAKQQAFYALLVRGEMLLKEQQKDPKAIDRAIHYFMKAIGLVPNPAEVIMAYEQTLPAEVFKRIVSELQDENKAKTGAYFERMAPESGNVRFEEVDGPKLAATGKTGPKQWTAFAAKDIDEETILMSEEADIAFAPSNEICDYCFKDLSSDTENNTSFAISDLRYCSKHCTELANESYAKSFENLSGTAGYAYQQLVNVVGETKSLAPLLLLRYISALLEDELKRQKDPSRIGLFAHYDYLRPAYRAPRDSDRAEAMLIRTILQAGNADIADFLTDEIYVAMKSTVMFNCIGIAKEKEQEQQETAEVQLPDQESKPQEVEKSVKLHDSVAFDILSHDGPIVEDDSEESTAFSSEIPITPISNESLSSDDKPAEIASAVPSALKTIEPIRYSDSTSNSKFFGLYHTLAHVAHSCDPNCRLVPDVQIPRRLRLIASRPLKSGEKITISYCNVVDGLTPSDRKAKIERDFYMICDCSKCN